MRASILTLLGLGMGLSGCGPAAQGLCDDGTTDCLNLDQQIDGEEENEAYVSEGARMCVTGEGRIYAAWTDDRKNFVDVYLNSSVDGGATWFPTPIRVKQGPGNASAVDLACVGERVYVVWEDTRDSDTDYQNIYYNFSTDGGVSWAGEDVRLDDDPEGRSISLAPKLAIGQGAVHVVWFDQLNGAPDIYVATSLRGNGNFEPPKRISGDENEPGQFWAGNPRAVVGGDGRLHVVWEDARNGAQDIFYSASNADFTAFGDQVRLTKGEDRGSTYGFSPSIELAGENVYVVWHDTRAGEATDIFMNYSGDGGTTWLEAAGRVESDAPGSAESRNPDVVVDGTTGHVVWQDNRNGGYDIYYRTVVAGSVEEQEEEVRLDAGDGRGEGNSIDPVLARRGNEMVAAWEDRRAAASEGLNDLMYNFFEADDEGDGDWDNDDFRLTSPQAGTTFTDWLNVDVVEGVVYSLWIDYRNGKNDPDVFFSSAELGNAVDTYEDIVGEGAATARTATAPR